MKSTPSSSRRGSALVTVMMLTMAMLIIISSTLSYSFTERRLNHREAMRLEARNAAEAISEYGLSQIRQKMELRSDFSPTRFTTGADAHNISEPKDAFWSGSRVVTSGVNDTELAIGLIAPVTNNASTGLFYYDPNDPANEFDVLKGRYAFRFDLKIIAKATVAPVNTAAGGPQTCYMSQTLSARAAPLFSYAIFYNMDLELWPGPTMNILGSVHTNANLWVKKQSTTNPQKSLNFMGPVSVAGEGHEKPTGNTFRGAPNYPSGLYSGVKTVIRTSSGGTDDLSSYTDGTFFTTTGGGLQNIRDTSVSPARWRDQRWGASDGVETAATQENFRQWTTQTFGGNLQTRLHGVAVANPPGIGQYLEDPTPANGVDNSINIARRLIEPPLRSTDSYPDGTATAHSDGTNTALYDATIEAQKYSTQSGIYIVVNPSTVSRFGRKPNGTLINIPAGKYRVFTKSGTELILPGQVDWGDDNLKPNTFTIVVPLVPGINSIAAGAKPIITIRPNAMVDMRRGRKTDGTAFSWSTARSSSNAYSPVSVDIIDVDMRELKLAIDRSVNNLATTTGYLTDTPADGTSTTAAAWTNFIYNPAAVTTNITLGNLNRITQPDPASPLLPPINWTGSGWNGAIYIESVEADWMSPGSTTGSRTRASTTPLVTAATNRDNASGVRLINGRGRIASTPSGDYRGLTIATNDAVYVLGHYNADGTINTATTGTTNSGRYPETDEKPASIVGDSLTILSAPGYTNNGSKIGQNMGWNDARSGNTNNKDSNYNSAWSTTSPSSSNVTEGVDTSVACYRIPYSKNNTVPFNNATAAQYLTISGSSSGGVDSSSPKSEKLQGNNTEISAAFLVGIVISNKDNNGQNSGGANNYPRFNEDFSVNGTPSIVAIRGSIVALFESRVATEPWNWRTFNAPDRLWGFNEIFNQGVFPPLTPKVMYYRRVDFNDITKTQYNALKTSWGL